MGADDALLAEPTPASGEGPRPTELELLVQVRDDIRALPERIAAAMAPGPPPAEVDGL